MTTDDPLRVMTFNLRHHRDERRGWHARREAVQTVVGRHAPDILGTQEGLLPQILDIQEALPHHEIVGEARWGGQEGEFVAIHYDARRFTCEEHGNFWFSDTPEVPGSMGWGNYVPRMSTWARLRDVNTDHAFTFVNTHLDHFHPGARKRAARLLHQMFPATQDEPMILVGDFNSLPRRYVYRHLTKRAGFVDAFNDAAERSHRFGRTFHGFTGRGLFRLDWILTRPAWQVMRHLTVRDRPGGVHPSDHFPVLATLAMPAA